MSEDKKQDKQETIAERLQSLTDLHADNLGVDGEKKENLHALLETAFIAGVMEGQSRPKMEVMEYVVGSMVKLMGLKEEDK